MFQLSIRDIFLKIPNLPTDPPIFDLFSGATETVFIAFSSTHILITYPVCGYIHKATWRKVFNT